MKTKIFIDKAESRDIISTNFIVLVVIKEEVMRLSTRTRYGTRLMLDLAQNYGKGCVLLKDIAKRQGISEKYLSQIVLLLKSRGLVRSFRGSKGGYVLGRDPSQVTLKEVIVALEGDINIIDCLKDEKVCSRVSFCGTRNLWQTIGSSISSVLEKLTLQDLVSQHKISERKLLMYSI